MRIKSCLLFLLLVFQTGTACFEYQESLDPFTIVISLSFLAVLLLSGRAIVVSAGYPAIITVWKKISEMSGLRLFLWACSKNNFELIEKLLKKDRSYYEGAGCNASINGYSFPGVCSVVLILIRQYWASAL
jgi:hypothetical protein